MTGLELHDRLALSDKPVPTILITAYLDDQIRTRALRMGVRCPPARAFAYEELLVCEERRRADVMPSEQLATKPRPSAKFDPA
jgi:CheY-like chemotaxis protein